MRIRSIKPEFWRSGDIDPNDSAPWKAFSPAPVGKTYLYRFFDAQNRLLYVGITWNPLDRWRVHRRSKPWWNEVAFYDLHLCLDERDARAWETWCIQTLNPIHNKQQNLGWHRRGKNKDDQA